MLQQTWRAYTSDNTDVTDHSRNMLLSGHSVPNRSVQICRASMRRKHSQHDACADTQEIMRHMTMSTRQLVLTYTA